MNILENSEFIKRLNFFADRPDDYYKFRRDIVFLDSRGYMHYLDPIWFHRDEVLVIHNAFDGKTNTERIRESWKMHLDGKLINHYKSSECLKHPELLLENCEFNLKDIFKQMDLTIVEML